MLWRVSVLLELNHVIGLHWAPDNSDSGPERQIAWAVAGKHRRHGLSTAAFAPNTEGGDMDIEPADELCTRPASGQLVRP